MSSFEPTRSGAVPPTRRWTRPETIVPAVLALALALGWSARERAFALEKDESLRSGTLTVDQVKMIDQEFRGEVVGHLGVYFQGDTPASTKFVAGRFILEPGKTNHLPHTHVEEEVLIVESGEGEIFCDGKTTEVGPGTIMYTTPNVPHGIKSTGSTPLDVRLRQVGGQGGSRGRVREITPDRCPSGASSDGSPLRPPLLREPGARCPPEEDRGSRYGGDVLRQAISRILSIRRTMSCKAARSPWGTSAVIQPS